MVFCPFPAADLSGYVEDRFDRDEQGEYAADADAGADEETKERSG